MSSLGCCLLDTRIASALAVCALMTGCGLLHNDLQVVRASAAVHLLPPHTTADKPIDQPSHHGIDGPVPAAVRVNCQSTLFPSDVRSYYRTALLRLGFVPVPVRDRVGNGEDDYRRGPLRAVLDIEDTRYLKPGEHTVFQYAVEAGPT